MIIHPDQRPAIPQAIQNLKEAFEKGVEKQNSLFVMKEIVTCSSNQPSENMVANDSLPDFTGKVLNQAFKVQITSSQHCFLALKVFTKDVNEH